MENLQLSRIDRSEITGIIEALDEVEAKKLHQDFYFSKNLGLTIFLGKPYAIGFFPKDEKPIRKTKKGYFGCGVVYIEPMNAKEDYSLLKVTNGCDH